MKIRYNITLFTNKYSKQFACLYTYNLTNLLKLCDIWLQNGYNIDIKSVVEL